jgi:hypothetical protein
MASFLRSRINVVWLLLVAATLFSWNSARTVEDPGDYGFLTFAVIFVAFVKVRFIGLEFMELRHAPRPLRLLFEIWVVVVCTAVLAAYYWGAAQ